LQHQDRRVRTGVASVLEADQISVNLTNLQIPETAVPTLLQALKDEDAIVRRSAVSALSSTSLDNEVIVPGLIEALKR
jgi:HEAT repeat protein